MRQFCFSFDSKFRQQQMIETYPDDFPNDMVEDDCRGFFEDFCEDSAYLFMVNYNKGSNEDYQKEYDRFVREECSYSMYQLPD